MSRHPAAFGCAVAVFNIAGIFHRVDDLNSVGIASLFDWQGGGVGGHLAHPIAAATFSLTLRFCCPAPA